MKKPIGIFLKTAIPILIGVVLIYYSISKMTPESRSMLWENIKNADPYWIGLSLLLGFISHSLRAYRWKYLLEPLGCKPRYTVSFVAVMIAYLANLGIPRSGEILRAVTLSNYEGLSFEKSFGTIISERVADLVMLLLVVGSAFFMQSGNLLNYLEQQDVNVFATLGIVALGLLLLVGFLRLIRRSQNKWLVKINGFLQGILEGIGSILKMKNKGWFILHTFLIWGIYLLMFWVIKFAIPGMEFTALGTILVAFVAGSFSISTTNGGLGIFPYPIVVGAVFVFSGISQEQGEAFGWVIWGSQTALNIVIGGLSFLLLPLLTKRATVQKEEAK
ncbi:MAG: lysylphosphatidylglycerol synthase transmembrane domain-containing protein [Gilvibacter sp.]